MLIDTLTAKLVADVSDFVSGMVKATAEVQKLQTTMTPAQANFAAMAQRANAVSAEVQKLQTTMTPAQANFAAMAQRASAVSRQLNAVGETAAVSTRGMNLLRGGLQSLAYSAAGIPGPLGRISTGLLAMSFGGPIVLGVLAGLAAIAGAWRLATSTARDLRRANDELTKSWEDALAAGRANVGAWLNVVQAQLKLEEAQDRVTKLQRTTQPGPAGRFGSPGVVARTDDLNAATDAVTRAQLVLDALTNTWHKAQVDIVVAGEQMGEAQREVADEFKIIQRSVEELVNDPAWQSFISNIPVIGAVKIPSAKGQPDLVTDIIREAKQTPQVFKDIVEQGENIRNSLAEAGDSVKLGAATLITAFAQMAATLVSGGSAGGFLAGLGGILSLVPGGQVAGAIVGGIGGILLANEANEANRHEELLAALEPVGETLFLLATGGQSAESLDSLVRRMEQATGRRISIRYGGS